MESRAWTDTFAAWTRADRDALPPDLTSLYDRVKDELAKKGAVAVQPVTVSMSDDHVDFFVRNQVAVVAEVRGLVLRHPNPFPPLRLFTWLPAGP